MNGKKQRIAIGASVLSAVAASLCCILPLAAVILGVSGFAASAVFVKWRPLLLAVTAALLAAAWYFTYRKPKAACCGEGACAATPAAKWNKLILWMATLVVVAVAAFPLYGGIFDRLLSRAATPGPTASASAPAAISPAANLATLKAAMPSLECDLCANGVQATVQKLPGVHDAQVSYSNKQAVVHYDPEKISPDKIIAAIDHTGYKAEPLNPKEQP